MATNNNNNNNKSNNNSESWRFSKNKNNTGGLFYRRKLLDKSACFVEIGHSFLNANLMSSFILFYNHYCNNDCKYAHHSQNKSKQLS